MDANAWARNLPPNAFQNTLPQPLPYNQFGYGVDGPVYIPGNFNRERNRLFFLFSQEWLRYRTLPTNTATVPSELMRQGDFSETLGPNNFFRQTYNILDPATCPPVPRN